MSDYKMTVYADPKGPTGHFSVSVSGPGLEKKVSGKYPGQGDAKLLLGNNPGEIRDDGERVKGEGVVEKKISLTAEQAANVRDFMNNAKTSPGNYQLLDDNCVDFVQGALDNAGNMGKLADKFDKAELLNMGSITSAGSNAIAKTDRNELIDYQNPIDGELGGTPAGDVPDQPQKPVQGDDEVKGSSGADSLVADESAKPDRRPEVESFLEDLKTSDNPLADILLKSTRDWTEDEVGQVHRSDAYADPLQSDVAGKVRQWFEDHYGTDPVNTDETGRMLDPVFTTVPRKEPVAAKGKDGQPVLDGVLGAGAKIAGLADKRGLSTAIRGVQSGLNLLGQYQADGRKKTGSLKTDGLFGPKTKQSFRNNVAELGAPRVENALALGSFQNLLDNKRGPARGTLGEVAHDSFSGLFQNDSPYKPADKSPTAWGLVVQDTINDVGAKTFGKGAFKPLKNDGWIGPKTAGAFDKVFKPTGMGGFMKSLSNNFGFF